MNFPRLLLICVLLIYMVNSLTTVVIKQKFGRGLKSIRAEIVLSDTYTAVYVGRHCQPATGDRTFCEAGCFRDAAFHFHSDLLTLNTALLSCKGRVTTGLLLEMWEKISALQNV
jgi:hypothetical protein